MARAGPGKQDQAEQDRGGPCSRALRFVRAAAAACVAAAWLLVAGLWLVGRIVGDRTLPTQYLEWMPTVVVAGCGLLASLAILVLAGRKSRRFVGVLTTAALVLGWLLFGEWALHRALTGSSEAPDDLRVAFMNISPGGNRADIGPVLDAEADVFVLSNVHPQRITFEKIYGFPPEQFLDRTIGISPGESPPGEIHALSYGMFRVYSKYPIRRRAAAHISPQDSWLEDDILGSGGILMLEIETPHGRVTVWAFDMPSTLGASRRLMFDEADARIAETRRVFEADAIGRWNWRDAEADDPIFSPDLVVGDFNTPAHAWSVGRLMPELRAVRDDAGIGPAGTFPAAMPLFEIDFARTGPAFIATRVERVRCAGCRHLGLTMSLQHRPRNTR